MCPLPIHYSICLPLSSLHPHSHCLLIFFSPLQNAYEGYCWALVVHCTPYLPGNILSFFRFSSNSVLSPQLSGSDFAPPPTHTPVISPTSLFSLLWAFYLSLLSLPQPIISVFLLLAALWFCLSCTLSPLCLLCLSVSHPLAHFLFQPFLSL